MITKGNKNTKKLFLLMIFAALFYSSGWAQNEVKWNLSDDNTATAVVYIDKAWEFEDDGSPKDAYYIDRKLSTDNVKLVDCKNTISFCVYTWENIDDTPNDIYLEDIKLRIRTKGKFTMNNGKIDDWWTLFRTDKITGNGNSDLWTYEYQNEGKIESFYSHAGSLNSSLSGTYKVNRRMYDNCDGRIYEFFSIQYKDGSDLDKILQRDDFYFTLYFDVCPLRDVRDKNDTIGNLNEINHYYTHLNIPKADIIEHGWKASDDGSGKTKYYVKLKSIDNMEGYGLQYSGCSLIDYDKSETTITYDFPDCANFSTDIVNNGNIDVRSYRKYNVDTEYYYKKAKNGLKTKFHSTRNIAMKKMLYPSTISASNLNDGTVQLSWKVNKVDNSEEVDMSKFVVQCSSDADFDNIVDTKEITYKKNKDAPYTCLMNIPDRNKGEKTYYFRLRRKNAAWNYPKMQTQLKVNTDYKKIAGMLSSQEGTKAVITWTLTDGLWNNDELAYSLEYKGGTPITPNDSSHIEKISIPTCEPTTFTLKILANGDVYNNDTIRVMLTNAQEGEIEKISASKGYFSNYVKLKWEADKDKDNIKYYTIDRKELNRNDESFTHLTTINHTAGVNSYNYKDNGSIAGVYYKYRIQAYQECNGKTGVVHSISDVGLAQPYGTVSGRITYKGGVAVKGAKVVAEGKTTGKNRAVYLYPNKWGLLLDAEKSANLFSEAEGTIQFWNNHYSADKYGIVQFAKGLSFWFRPNLFYVKMRTPKEDLNFEKIKITDTAHYHTPETYTHYTLSYKSKDSVNYDMNLYINGKLAKNWKWKKTNLNSHVNDSVGMFGFYGAHNLIDELRCWNRALDTAEISQNYDSYISGKEEGLTAYYRCDEEVNNMLFDISKTGDTYNERHLKMTTIYAWHTSLPQFLVPGDKLALKTYTDEDGNYMMNNIPYTEDGSRYNITPSFHEHKFNPSKSPLFFNSSANTHNNIDFEDVSSFKVSGTVTYAGGNYPVEGVQISIDGMVASKDGKIITTNKDGEYEVEVPIGDHFISVSKTGHKFANKGRYPALKGTKYTFEKPMSGLKFVDSTRVLLVGRVTGGERENKKPLCFGKSIANLGKATITLNPVNDKYKLRTNAGDSTIDIVENDTIKCTCQNIIKGDKKKNQIVITTDAVNGEFLAYLPPIPYEVVDVSVGKKGTENYLGGTDFKVSEIPDFTPNINIEKKDSIIIDTINLENKKFKYQASYKFNHILKINYRVDPEIQITENSEIKQKHGNITPVGDMNYTCKNGDIINLYTINKGVVNFYLGHPLFTKSEQYTWKVSAFEKYTNMDDVKKVDRVPLINKVLNISNALASTRVYLDRSDSIAHDPSKLELDSMGTAIYSFKAGFPKMTGNHLLTASFSLKDNGKTTKKELTGIVVGSVPVPGKDFVTEGPDIVQYVLRDPPGSNSYAYLEKGTTFETDFSLIRGGGLHNNTTLNEKFGVETVTGTGFGVIVEIETEAKAEASQEWDMTIERNNGHSTHTSSTTLNRIETSDSEEYVGAMADVYMGTSTNYVFGTVKTLGLYNKIGSEGVEFGNKKRYKLEEHETSSADVNFTTMFNYTQNHIVDYLIPNIKKLRNEKIEVVSQIPKKNNGSEYKYYSTIPEDDENFGEEGYYTALAPSNIPKGEIAHNDVKAKNSWIKNWERVIADNEKAKLLAFKDKKRLEENVSFDAGAKIEKSKGEESSSTWTTIIEHHDEISIGGKTGAEIMGVGFELEEKLGALVNYEKTDESTSSESKTYGYVLSDNDQGDYFSVDVINPDNNNKVIHEKYTVTPKVDIDIEADIDVKNIKEFIYPTLSDDGESILISGNNPLVNDQVDVSAGISAGKAVTLNLTIEGDNVEVKIKKLDLANEYRKHFKKYWEHKTGLFTSEEVVKNNKFDTIIVIKRKSILGLGAIWVDEETTLINRAKGSYIFRLRAGRSSCPYEGPEEPLFCKKYYPKIKVEKNDYLLSVGTKQIEKPVLYVGGGKGKGGTKDASIANIPSGREGSFDLELTNKSDAGLDVTYQLSVVSGTNPDGLILSIDGEPLTEPRQFHLDPDKPIKKTLKVKQSSLDVLKYENIGLQLTSVCQNDPGSDIGWIGDKINLNVEFVPSSSPVKFEVPKLLINSGTKDGLSYTISEYDTTFKNFASILIKYKAEHEQTWKTAHYFVHDDELSNIEDKQKSLIKEKDIRGKCTGSLDLSAEPDGVYYVKAVSRSHFGSEYIEVESDEFKIIKDTKNPKPLGKPNPVSGIYTGENEISVLFNEDIQSEMITKNFIAVKGKLNGSTVDHSVAAKFIGNGAQTDASIALANKSFSIEAWIKRDINKAGTLFAHGKDFSLSFTADNRMKVRLGGKEFTSNDKFTQKDWQHISFTYDNAARRFSVIVSSNRFSFTDNSLGQQTYQGNGLLYVGSEKDKSNGYSGAVHELTLWSKARTEGDLSDIHTTKTGREPNLIGYWRMDEGHGIMAKDIARSRHLILPGENSWYLNNINYAAQFNGKNSYHISAAKIPFNEGDNFTIEFWFMGNKQINVSLFACGDGIKDIDPSDRMSIGFDTTSNLVLRAKGVSNIISNRNLLDGNWHHYALNLVRNGYASTYIDGKLVNQLEASKIGALSYSEYTIGASKYKGKDNAFHIERNFTGSIDEIRVWNATLTPSVIKHNIYNRMLGDEKGLAAYYPFEQTYKDEGNVTQHKASLAGFVGLVKKEKTNATQTGGELFNKTNVAPLKKARSDEKIASEKLSFVTSNNKVVININEPKYRLEGQTFEITLEDVADLNGNEMETLKWTAYFNQNSLKWNDDELDFIQEHLKSEEKEITISNNGGKAENWVISGMPEWLELSKTQGVLKPLEKAKIKVKTAASTPIGSYETTLSLQGNNQISEQLPVNLKVTGEKPDWSCNPDDFEFSMSIIGELRIDNLLSEDPEDILGAFVGNTCVGLASPQYFKTQNTFMVMMNVYGNKKLKGKKVTFKVWDASTGYTYPIVSTLRDIKTLQEIKLINEKIYGEFYKPIIFNAKKQLQQRIHLTDGWNWLSLNVLNNNMSLDNICNNINSTTELIKDKKTFSVYENSSWSGELETFGINKMYKIKSKADVDFVCSGRPIVPSLNPITLKKGWNWIGYTPQQSIPLKSALADLEPSNGDIIKSKSSFAVYNGFEWIGLLEYMTPGYGYMYKSAKANEFHYPDRYVPTSRHRMKSGKNNVYKPETDDYSGNMSIIAIVKKAGKTLNGYELGAFANDECRGTASPKDDGLVFLTVAGDDERNDSITFKVYDYSTNKELETEKIKIKYSNDLILGSTNKPYIINLKDTIFVTGVSIEYVNDCLLKGTTSQLKAKITPANATNKKVSWSSSDTAIAKVDNNGLVTAFSSGETKITVTTDDGGFKANCKITVVNKAIAVTGITLNETAKKVEIGETFTLKSQIAPKKATNKKVSWSSSNTAIAKVDEHGLVRALKPGKADITVTTEDGGFKAVCKLTVTKTEIAVTGIKLSETAKELKIGKTFTFKPIITPKKATNKKVRWTSRDTAIAKINENGLVTALKLGQTVITVTTEDGGFKATCKLTVIREEIAVTGITLNETAKELNVGETFTIKSSITPEKATNKQVSWNSSDTAIAKVDENGLVTALTPGETIITVTTEDGGFKATCKLTVIREEIAVTGITLNETAKELEVGETFTIKSSITPEKATNKKVRWNSSDTAIAVVDAKGLITALRPGETIVYVTTLDGSFTAICKITVKAATGINESEFNSNNPKISIYPNPSSGRFTVEVSANCKAKIITNSGQVIQMENLQKGKNEINISKSGIYFINFKGVEFELIKKIIVTK